MHICVHASNTRLVLATQLGDTHVQNQEFHFPPHILAFWECGWEDLHDGCAEFLVFHVSSTRTLMRKDAPPTMGTPEDTSP